MKIHLRIGEVIAVMLLAACAMPGEGDEDDGGNEEPSLETTTSAVTNGDLDAADIVRIVRNAERGHNAPLPMDERADYIVRESRRTGVPVWLILGQANNETNYGCAPCGGNGGNSTVQDNKLLYDSQGHTKRGNAYNIFGIRPNAAWTGYKIDTANGTFKAYTSWEHSITDYVNLLMLAYRDMTLLDLAKKYAPRGDGNNNPEAYADNIVLLAGANGIQISRATVVVPTPSARFDSKFVHPTMVSGQSYGVWVEMKNTGTTTWYPEMEIKLGAQNPRDNVTWGNNRVRLFRPTRPGETYTFNFTVVAPPPGVYNFQWQMVQEMITWFGEPSPNVVVQVTPSPSKAFGPQRLANFDFERRTLSPWAKYPPAAPGLVAVEPCCGNLTPHGSWNAKLVPKGQDIIMYQSVTVQPNKRYELRARVALGWKGMRALLRWWWSADSGASGNVVCQEANSGVSWPNFQDLQCVFQTPPNMSRFNVQLTAIPSPTAPSDQWVVTDEWSLRESN